LQLELGSSFLEGVGVFVPGAREPGAPQCADVAHDLDRAVRRGEEALAICRAEDIVCPTVWVFYTDILRGSFEVTTNTEEIRMAEMLCRDAMSLCAPVHPLNSTTLLEFWIRYERRGCGGGVCSCLARDARRYLEAFLLSFLCLFVGLDCTVADKHSYSVISQSDDRLFRQICHALSWIYFRQFYQTGDEEGIEKAASLQRVGLARLSEAEFHNRHRHLCRLAEILMRNQFHGEGRDKDDTLSIVSEAYRLCPPTHVDK
jgi:hypothetical protein